MVDRTLDLLHRSLGFARRKRVVEPANVVDLKHKDVMRCHRLSSGRSGEDAVGCERRRIEAMGLNHKRIAPTPVEIGRVIEPAAERPTRSRTPSQTLDACHPELREV